MDCNMMPKFNLIIAQDCDVRIQDKPLTSFSGYTQGQSGYGHSVHEYTKLAEMAQKELENFNFSPTARLLPDVTKVTENPYYTAADVRQTPPAQGSSDSGCEASTLPLRSRVANSYSEAIGNLNPIDDGEIKVQPACDCPPSPWEPMTATIKRNGRPYPSHSLAPSPLKKAPISTCECSPDELMDSSDGRQNGLLPQLNGKAKYDRFKSQTLENRPRTKLKHLKDTISLDTYGIGYNSLQQVDNIDQHIFHENSEDGIVFVGDRSGTTASMNYSQRSTQSRRGKTPAQHCKRCVIYTIIVMQFTIFMIAMMLVTAKLLGLLDTRNKTIPVYVPVMATPNLTTQAPVSLPPALNNESDPMNEMFKKPGIVILAPSMRKNQLFVDLNQPRSYSAYVKRIQTIMDKLKTLFVTVSMSCGQTPIPAEVEKVCTLIHAVEQDCTLEQAQYGFAEGTPCILLHVEYGIIGSRQGSKDLWAPMHCEGAEERHKKRIGILDIYPKQGFYIPRLENSEFPSFVWVRMSNIAFNTPVKIVCSVDNSTAEENYTPDITFSVYIAA